MFLDPRQRTVAIGVWIASFSAGAAIGPLLGGMLLEYFWWGSVFLLAVPVMVLLLVLGPMLLPEYRDPDAGRLDLLSAALSLVAVLAVIYGLKQIAEDGLGWRPVLSIVAGLAIGRAVRAPPAAPGRPADRPRSCSGSPAFSAVAGDLHASASSSCSASFLFIAQYLQLVLGLSPLEAGLWTLPVVGAAFVLGSMLAPVAGPPGAARRRDGRRAWSWPRSASRSLTQVDAAQRPGRCW